MTKAKDNPFGISLFAIGGLGLGAGLWVWQRRKARGKLAELLAASPMVLTASAWNYIQWTPEDKAASMITTTNTIGVDAAYMRVLAEVRALMPEEEELQLGADMSRLIEDKLVGMGLTPEKIEETKAQAASLYSQLPDVPLIDTSGWLPDWITGAGA